MYNFTVLHHHSPISVPHHSRFGAGVQILAATNRPEALDSALLRPGRMDVILYVPPPDATGRLQTLHIHTSNMPLAPDVDLKALADACDLFTGAELAGLCQEAAITALREDLEVYCEAVVRHHVGFKPPPCSDHDKQNLCMHQ